MCRCLYPWLGRTTQKRPMILINRANTTRYPALGSVWQDPCTCTRIKIKHAHHAIRAADWSSCLQCNLKVCKPNRFSKAMPRAFKHCCVLNATSTSTWFMMAHLEPGTVAAHNLVAGVLDWPRRKYVHICHFSGICGHLWPKDAIVSLVSKHFCKFKFHNNI